MQDTKSRTEKSDYNVEETKKTIIQKTPHGHGFPRKGMSKILLSTHLMILWSGSVGSTGHFPRTHNVALRIPLPCP